MTVSGQAVGYVRSDIDPACLTLWHCPTCGCVTHWTGLGDAVPDRVGINARMLDPAVTEDLPVRHVDGASW